MAVDTLTQQSFLIYRSKIVFLFSNTKTNIQIDEFEYGKTDWHTNRQNIDSCEFYAFLLFLYEINFHVTNFLIQNFENYIEAVFNMDVYFY